VFEPHTEIIRKGKGSKPNEFSKQVKVPEAENQIITHYEVFAERPEASVANHYFATKVASHKQISIIPNPR
jgi:hypothetical protein